MLKTVQHVLMDTTYSYLLINALHIVLLDFIKQIAAVYHALLDVQIAALILGVFHAILDFILIP